MKIACVGAGPAGLYFAISMKLRDPSHDVTVFERNAAGRHVRLGRSVFGPDRREFARATIRSRRRSSPTNSHIGTTSTSTSAARRSRRGGTGSSALAASVCSKSCRIARANWASDRVRCRMRSRRSEVARLRSRHCLGRHQFALPRRATRMRSASTSMCGRTSSSGWGRRRSSTPSPSRSRRPSRAGSGRTPIASRRTARPSSSSVRKRRGAISASTGWSRPRRSQSAKGCSPNISTVTA